MREKKRGDMYIIIKRERVEEKVQDIKSRYVHTKWCRRRKDKEMEGERREKEGERVRKEK